MQDIQNETGDGIEISVSDLSYSIEGKEILRRVSMQMHTKRLGILGRNGSGKSTFARLLAGLVDPTDGDIRVNGYDLGKDRKAALRQVGILFQNPDHQIIFPTVIEEIAFGLTQLGQPKPNAEENARATLAKFGKSHWEEVYVTALSQGQKHLLCLMAVAAMGPTLLILDEPFSGLDIPTKMQLNRYLAQYEGALVHITHDPRDLDGYDHVIWLEQGEIKENSDDLHILDRYTTEMTRIGGMDDLSDLSG